MADYLENGSSLEVDVFTTSELGMNEADILETKKLLKRGEKIGSGGYGVVYRMSSTIGDSRPLACKVIDLQKTLRKHFTSELNLKSCKHENLIELVDQFIINNNAFILMEYANGGSISDLITNNKPIAEALARQFFRQIFSGLEYLHHKRIAHRDLKLDNLLFLNSNEKCKTKITVKITDFGLSLLAYHSKEGYIESGNFAGTRPYAAPEVSRIRVFHEFRGEFSFEFNPFTADIWSLGVCLFEMLTGVLPFIARNDEEMFTMQTGRKYTFPKIIQVSSLAKELVSQMLEPSADIRLDPFGIRHHAWLNNQHDDADRLK